MFKIATFAFVAAVAASVAGCGSTPDVYTYEVFSSDAGTALVTYITDANMTQAQETAAGLPWSKSVEASGAGLVLLVTAQGSDGVDELSCRITRDGQVISENTVTGFATVVSCNT